MAKKNDTHWGCPECGSTDVTATVEADVKQVGRIVDDGGHYRFSADDEERGEIYDINEVTGYECADCNEDFERPVLVYEVAGPRLRVKLSVEAIMTKEVCRKVAAFMEDEDSPLIGEFNLELDIPSSEVDAKVKIEALKAFVRGLFIQEDQ